MPLLFCFRPQSPAQSTDSPSPPWQDPKYIEEYKAALDEWRMLRRIPVSSRTPEQQHRCAELKAFVCQYTYGI